MSSSATDGVRRSAASAATASKGAVAAAAVGSAGGTSTGNEHQAERQVKFSVPTSKSCGMSKVFQRSCSTAGVFGSSSGGGSLGSVSVTGGPSSGGGSLSKQQSLVKNTSNTASPPMDEKHTGLSNIPEDTVSTLC